MVANRLSGSGTQKKPLEIVEPIIRELPRYPPPRTGHTSGKRLLSKKHETPVKGEKTGIPGLESGKLSRVRDHSASSGVMHSHNHLVKRNGVVH